MYACEYGDRLRLAVHVHVRERKKVHEKRPTDGEHFSWSATGVALRSRESDMSVVVHVRLRVW